MTTPDADSTGAQRAATRAPVELPVRIQFDDSTDVVDGSCSNISIGGFQALLSEGRDAGAQARFELTVAEGALVRGLAEVVWHRRQPSREGDEDTVGSLVGLKFRFLEQRDRQAIFKLVSRHIRDRLESRQPFAGIELSPLVLASQAAERRAASDAGQIDSTEAAEPPSPLEDLDEPPVDDSHQDAAPDWVDHAAAAEPAISPPIDVAESTEMAARDEETPAWAEPVEPWTDDPAADIDPAPVYGDDLDDDLDDDPEWPVETAMPVASFFERWRLPIVATVAAVAALLIYLFGGSWLSHDGDSEPVAKVEAAADSASKDRERRLTRPPPPPTSRAPAVQQPVPRQAKPTPPPQAPAAQKPASRQATGEARFSAVTDIAWRQRGGEIVVTITTDGSIPDDAYDRFRLAGQGGSAGREVVRLYGVRNRFDRGAIDVGQPLLSRIRTGRHPGRSKGPELHVVLDLADAEAEIRRLSVNGQRLEISLGR